MSAVVTVSLRSTLARAWARLRGGELTPAKAALSVALGLMVGVTPLWGLHFWIVLGVGLLFRLDVPVAYLAANISIPPLLPFITIAEIEIGSLVRTGALVGISREELSTRGAMSFLKDVWVGTAVLGPVLALLGGGITYAIAGTRRTKGAPATRDEDVVHKVVERYRGASFGTRMYVSSKLSSDPVTTAIAALGKLGRALDIGCGRGQLALFLLETGAATHVSGVDWDEAKIAVAKAAAADLEADFAVGDARSATLPACDTVLLVDVLHYFAPEEQSAIVRRAAKVARARVVVRDIDPDRGWRSTMTKLQERLTTGARYNRGERVLARSIDALAADLEAEGFTIEVSPCWGNTPFSNVLVVGTRSEVGSPPTA